MNKSFQCVLKYVYNMYKSFTGSFQNVQNS